MNITLKNVKTFEGHDGMGLNADIYLDNKKVAHVFDGAYGGEFEYTTYDKEGFEKIEEYIKTLPDHTYEMEGCKPLVVKMDLDILVDNLFNEIEKKKLEKKMQKKMEKKFIVGVPGGNKFTEIGWKIPLKEAIHFWGLERIQKELDKIVSELPEGKQVLNTNLKKLGLRI